MPRWIVFDQDTASKLRSRLPQASVFEAPGRAALEYALGSPKSVVTVLPAMLGTGSISAVAVFRPGRPKPAPPGKSFSVRATGFLGLNDAPVLEEEEEDEKRRWWEFWKE
jgi:hypothetical protein